MRNVNLFFQNLKSAFTLFVILGFFITVAQIGHSQTNGIYESYAILDINGGGNSFYDMQASTANPDLNGNNLGSFNSSNSLVIKGGQNKTFKCDGGDIFNGNLRWRVWLTSAGASGSFNSETMSFVSNDGGGCGGNQTWEGTSGLSNLLASLTTPGNYTLDVYSEADGVPGTAFSNNGGANYRATFDFCGPSSGALPAGNYSIPGCFASVAAAVSYINTNGITGSGGVQFDVASGHTETAPNGGITITATGTLANQIIFKKSGIGANPTITANGSLTTGILHDAIIEILGSDYITIDGFTLIENGSNTTTVAGTNNMTEWGVALLYASTTNGAQNCTIQNCTITLNRTYQNTFGIYSNSTHSSSNITTSATATTIAGGNSSLKIYGNTISNVNQGICVVGPTPTADQNTGLDIGGAGGIQANSITNWGTTGTFSGYANVSGTVNGILIRNSNGFIVSNNTITSSVGGVTSGTLNGIQIPAASNTPTGTFTNTINNNSISLRSGLIAGAINGINIPSGSASTTSTLNINSNDFNTFGHTVAGTGAITFITNASTHQFCNINSNTFSNISVNTTGSVTFISNTYTNSSATGIKNVNGNSIVGSFSKTGAGGTVTIFTDNGSDVAGSINNSNNNNFSNITVIGATVILGLSNTNGGSPTKGVTGNTISNWIGGTSGITGMAVSFSGSSTVSGNTVNNISSAGAITGITSSSGTLENFTQNTVHTLISTGSSVVTGMSNTGGTTKFFSRNKIYNLEANNAGGSVNGMLVSAGITVTLQNNIIGDLRTPVSNAANPLIGLNLTGGTTVNAYYNTVYINGTSSGALFGSSAISASTTPALTSRNNIFVNNSTFNGSGLAVAHRRSTTTLTTYQNASNNNLFFATSAIFTDGTNTDVALTAYKTRVGPTRDAVTITENPTFLSTSGSSANFLHIDPSVATQIESGAAPIAGITDDFDGDTRNVTTPDIGADEGVFTLADLTSPVISYNPLSFTCNTSNRTLTASITDASGVPTSGIGLPVLYWRINTGSWMSATGTHTGGDNYDFTFGTGVASGDVVQYYIVAQDNAGTPNVGAFPSAGASGYAANPPAVATPPTTPSSYTISNTLSGTYTVGAGEDFETLSAAVTAYNISCLTGAVVFELTDATYNTGSGEAFPITILQHTDASAVNTLTIRPELTVTTTLTGSTSGAILRLNGADWVTLDGSNNGTNTRDWTISNSNTGTSSTVIWVSSANASDGATNNTFKNLIVRGNTSTTTFASIISSASGTLGGIAESANNNNSYINNRIFASAYGIGLVGPNGNESGTTVYNNSVGSTLTTEKHSFAGIAIFQQQNVNVSGNSIIGISRSASDNNGSGIFISGTISGGSVNANTITDIKNTNTSGYAATGIRLNSSSTNTGLVISNNFVSDIAGYGWSGNWTDNGHGINVSSGGGYNIYFNSVNMATNQTVAANSAALAITNASATDINIRNNILVMSQTTGTRYSIYTATLGAAFSQINYNDYVSSGNIGFLASARTTLTDWQTATGQDVNSVSIAPVFVTSTDLHLVPASNATLDNLGTPIVGITTDIDGDTRNMTTPDLGADEFMPPLCAVADGGTITPDEFTRCAGQTYNMASVGASTGSGITYQWEISPTGGGVGFVDVSGATSTSYMTSTLTSGIYYYRLLVTCSEGPLTGYSNEFELTVNPSPVITSLSSNSPLCETTTLNLFVSTDILSSFSWTGPNSFVSTDQNPEITNVALINAGTYTVTALAGGCSSTASTVVIVNQNPIINSTTANPSSFCGTGNSQLDVIPAFGANRYNFSASSGSFTPLVGGVDVNSIEQDDAISGAIPIGFPFTFAGTNYTNVYASSNGFLSFNASAGNAASNNLTSPASTLLPLLAPLWDDLNGDVGQISYLTEGVSPNQVFTFEWLNMKWNWQASSAVLSFQVKLYEVDNRIDFIYRQEAGTYNAGFTGGASIGITSATGNYLSLNNTSASPTASSTSETSNLNTKPLTGQVYTFTPPIFSYLWAPNQNPLTADNIRNPIAQNLSATTMFNVTVTDQNSCSATGNTTVTISPAVVTNSADAGVGTLRDVLNCVQDGGTITYDQPTTVTTLLTNQLAINKSVTIMGVGPLSKPEITVDFTTLGMNPGILISNNKTVIFKDVDLDEANNSMPPNAVLEVQTGSTLRVIGSTDIKP